MADSISSLDGCCVIFEAINLKGKTFAADPVLRLGNKTLCATEETYRSAEATESFLPAIVLLEIILSKLIFNTNTHAQAAP